MNLNRALLLFSIAAAFASGALRAQSPMTVVQAATPAPASSVAATPAPSNSNATLLPLLQQMKATNEETLKKQKAVLGQLDDLQKAAEQMKAFSKRG